MSSELPTSPLDQVSNSDDSFTGFEEVVFIPEHLQLQHSASHFGTECQWLLGPSG